MNKQAYIEKLLSLARSNEKIASDSGSELNIGYHDGRADAFDDMAQELEAMDVVWVPRVPSDLILNRGDNEFYRRQGERPGLFIISHVYHAMLNAAEADHDRCKYCGGKHGLHAIGCERAAGKSVKRREANHD